MKTPESILSAATQLRSYHAVCVLGAGVSLSGGVPLVADLRNLLWTAFDTHPEARKVLASRLNRKDCAAKRLITQSETATTDAWVTLAEHAQVRSTFQRAFASLDAQRASAFSAVHSNLAQLLHRRVIESVVSLNWDTLLEAAYRHRYGAKLQRNEWLFKPHGDAANPEQPWVLPHEAGRIPDTLIRELRQRTGTHPRVLLIIGYSERDEEVVKKLIQPVEEQWHVIRIGPNAKGDGSVPLAAADALAQLVTTLDLPPETPEWEYVTFQPQRGLEAAIAGKQLGPSDVQACPACEEVNTVQKRLLAEFCVWLTGESGAGKSLAAYQTAFACCREGWETLRLVSPDLATEEALNPLSHLPRPTLLLVDDAERLPESLRRRLTEVASARMSILFCASGDGPANAVSIRIDPLRAVRTIHAALTARSEETLAAVRRVDFHVGDSPFDTPLESRLAEAAKSEMPWQFMFTMGAGWQRARTAMAEIRAENGTDELLVAIAVRQLVTLDAPVDNDWLDEAAILLGRDTSWVRHGVAELTRRRLLVGRTGLRCAHQRFAAVVVELSRETVESAKSLVRLFRAALTFRHPPLRGISRLLHALRMTEASDYLRAGALLDAPLLDAIHDWCFEASAGVPRRDALFALEAMLDWQAHDFPRLRVRRPLLSEWLTHLDAEEGAAFGNFLNQLRQRNRHLANQIIRGANPCVLAVRVSDAQVTSFALWGKILGEFWSGGPRWRKSFGDSLKVARLRKRVAEVRADDLWKLSLFLGGINNTNPALALSLTRAGFPALVKSLHRKPASTFVAIEREILWEVFGYYPDLFGKKPPSAPQVLTARKLVTLLNPRKVARGLNECPRRQWEGFAKLLSFIRHVSRRHHERIVNEMNFSALNQMTAGLWSDVPRELEALLRAFSIGKDHGRSRKWLTMHSDEVQRVRPILVIYAPEPIAERVRAGAAVDLEISDGHHWLLAGCAIFLLRRIDKALAKHVVDESVPALAAGFSHLQRLDCEHFPIFCKLIDEISPHVFSEASRRLEMEPASKLWTSLAKGKAVERRALNALLKRLKPIPAAFRSLHRKLKRLLAARK